MFRCQKCLAETCRKCGKDWCDHWGKRCEEIESDGATAERLKIEEQMTLAMKRSAPRADWD